MRSRDIAGVLVVAVAFVGVPGAAGETGTDPLDDCDVRVRDAPRDPLSYYCYYVAFRAGAPGDDTVRRLEGILAFRPDLHRARLILGMVEDLRGQPRAESLLREAIAGMVSAGDHHGVVYGSLSLAFRLNMSGRLDEAGRTIDRAEAAAIAADDLELIASVHAEQALHARRRDDYGRSLRLYRLVQSEVFPDGPAWLQGNVLNGLAWTYWYFDDLPRSMALYAQEAELRIRSGDRFGAAQAQYNHAFLASVLAARGEFSRDRLDRLVASALDATVRFQTFGTEGYVRLMRAQYLAGEAAVEECERVMAIAERAADSSLRWDAMTMRAVKMVQSDPARAEEALSQVDSAVAEARAAGIRMNEAMALQQRAGLVARFRNRDDTIAAWTACIDVVESIGERQPEDRIRTYSMAQWSRPYHRLVTYLLNGLGRSPDPTSDLERAFRTTERRRARVRADVIGTGPPRSPQRDEILRNIAATQRRLLQPELSESDRNDLLASLEALEIEEQSLRDRIARESRREEHDRNLTTLAEVRAALRPDEIMLLYETVPRWHGSEDDDRPVGSWLFAITPEDVEVRSLEPEDALADRIDVFEGMTSATDAIATGAAVDLYRTVIAGVLEGTERRLRRVILVPDGPLHRLPFAALRSSVREVPIGARLEIVIVPSATAWAEWRSSPSDRGDGTVLVLADPDITSEAVTEAFRASGPWIEGLTVGRLPGARQEARRIARRARSGSRVLVGSEASEHALKSIDPATYGVLHLATHAVVDDARPQRSAVLLAPGSPHEDGLLQVREIVDLDLRDHVVVLSACRGASGPVIEGAGVMGLAQAFLQAGARAVVANLWPYRDDDATAMSDVLTREIGRGADLGAALAAARRVRARAGVPPESWAGLVLIGDGDFVAAPRGGRFGALAAAVILTLAALAAIAIGGRRRAGRP